MIIVVSDASPIINLAAVSRLPLLQELFGSVLVPPSVSSRNRRPGGLFPR